MPRPHIPNPDQPAWHAQDADFKRYFGLEPKMKWPANGMDVVTVNGVKLWVNALKPGSRKHRLMALCPACKKIVSGGTFAQHSRTMHEK